MSNIERLRPTTQTRPLSIRLIGNMNVSYRRSAWRSQLLYRRTSSHLWMLAAIWRCSVLFIGPYLESVQNKSRSSSPSTLLLHTRWEGRRWEDKTTSWELSEKKSVWKTRRHPSLGWWMRIIYFRREGLICRTCTVFNGNYKAFLNSRRCRMRRIGKHFAPHAMLCTIIYWPSS